MGELGKRLWREMNGPGETAQLTRCGATFYGGLIPNVTRRVWARIWTPTTPFSG
jgi:hypothetical protein